MSYIYFDAIRAWHLFLPGVTEWQKRVAKRLGLESAYRSPGRPSIVRGTSELGGA